ncbi:hypothetical protein ODZ84_22635 [Chryseobacterium fluminis]|uniref:hypothetical protein n=1 Tax=Chryseobacterium fluminis TaxID=2983606 RepID=UPI00225B3D20|nr:hypothetical protein [Chryseobacterium sp. MMS21-Ot14]UZT97930.1 hypothetical protein ODZ84_22635 [Chryseobacterium sp. MMS21-Ot14]
MRKNLKDIFLIILAVSILAIVYFFSKWNKIDIDENIGKSREINDLNSKVFDPAFLMFDSAKIRTDFEIFEKEDDTVSFNLKINKSLRSENIYSLTFKSGDGFSGINIDVLKYRNFSYTSAEFYTDDKSMFDFINSGRYTLKKQKLTLNKSQYKKGDSIFGKIELQIKFNPTDSIVNSRGYFRSIIE